jgi:AcrR family transcriptional regulator
MGTRNPFEASDVVSRRGGPVKQPLSRDAIVAEALKQLTRDGVDSMSLRKVAAALDTGPASLYVYVTDLDELQALVFDRALARVNVRAGKHEDWRERVKALMKSYLRVLVASPGVAQLAFRRAAVGPNALRFVDTVLGELSRAGLDRRTAAWAVDLLLLYVTASAAEQGQRETNAENDRSNPDGAVARAIREVSAKDYPHIHAAREELVSGDGQREDWAIDSILNGVAPAARSAGEARPRETKATRSQRGSGPRGAR